MQWEEAHGVWISTLRQSHAMETSIIMNPPVAADSSRAACSHRSQGFLDGEKTGAALLFSGAFLALVGVTFTAMGWKSFQPNSSFQWTRLLGPILISSGGTFILTSVCKFGMRTCWPCGQPQDEMFVIPVREQPSGRPPFMRPGVNQPVVLQGGAAMLCVPPAYSFMSPDVDQAGGSVSDVAVALPSYDAVFSVDNAAGEGRSSGSTEAEHRSGSLQKTEEETRRTGRCSSTCSQPPAYEDIYPSSHKPNSS